MADPGAPSARKNRQCLTQRNNEDSKGGDAAFSLSPAENVNSPGYVGAKL
jgi:hypothetical protein